MAPIHVNHFLSLAAILAGIKNNEEIIMPYNQDNLFWACRHGRDKFVASLLKEPNIEINKADRDGWTPLHWACSKGHSQVVDVLLTNGAEIFKANRFNELPLQLVPDESARAVIDVLVAKEVNVSLVWACTEGCFGVAEALLDSGADVNKADIDGTLPLSAACFRGDLEMAKLLYKHGADINKADNSGRTAFLVACRNGDLSLIEWMLGCGASINKACNAGFTPLFAACLGDDLSVIKFLLAQPGILIDDLSFEDFNKDPVKYGPLMDKITTMREEQRNDEPVAQANQAIRPPRQGEGEGSNGSSSSSFFVKFEEPVLVSGVNAAEEESDGPLPEQNGAEGERDSLFPKEIEKRQPFGKT